MWFFKVMAGSEVKKKYDQCMAEMVLKIFAKNALKTYLKQPTLVNFILKTILWGFSTDENRTWEIASG